MSDRFIRLPTELLEALLRAPLNGTQWRIVGWVVRHTYGWNRDVVRFSWYRIARDLSIDRGGAVRAGRRLMQSGILRAEGGKVCIQKNRSHWNLRVLAPPGERAMTGVSADGRQRKPVTENIATDDTRHRKRCQETALPRRVKDSRKDRLKTYIEMQRATAMAGAAKPIPGKYDRLSKN